MKAKIIKTGEIVEVVDRTDTQVTVYRNNETEFFAQNEYSRDEVEFLSDTPEEVTIEGWVVRDANPHSLRFFDRQPARLSDMWGSVYSYYNTMQLDPIMFPSVTWESEPQKVKITITPIQ